MSQHEVETLRGLTPREFAKRYGLAEGSVYKAIRNGEIPAIRVGTRLVCLPDEFERRAGAALEKADPVAAGTRPVTLQGDSAVRKLADHHRAPIEAR